MSHLDNSFEHPQHNYAFNEKMNLNKTVLSCSLSNCNYNGTIIPFALEVIVPV